MAKISFHQKLPNCAHDITTHLSMNVQKDASLNYEFTEPDMVLDSVFYILNASGQVDRQ